MLVNENKLHRELVRVMEEHVTKQPIEKIAIEDITKIIEMLPGLADIIIKIITLFTKKK